MTYYLLTGVTFFLLMGVAASAYLGERFRTPGLSRHFKRQVFLIKNQTKVLLATSITMFLGVLVLVMMTETLSKPDAILDFVFGLIVVEWGVLLIRNCLNLAANAALQANPDLISGSVTMGRLFALFNDLASSLPIVVALLLLLLIQPSAAVLGGVVGSLFLLGIQIGFFFKSSAN